MMQINVNFVLFEELKERTDGSEAVARIVIVRESRDAHHAHGDDEAGFIPLE